MQPIKHIYLPADYNVQIWRYNFYFEWEVIGNCEMEEQCDCEIITAHISFSVN